MKDQYGRTIDYMRISVTDRCNLRCRYCMPDGITQVPMAQILTFEEIETVCRAAVRVGITRFKITGGEPLVRLGCAELIGRIKKIPGAEQVTLTTNGILLGSYLDVLVENGTDAVNVSLDTLKREAYREITGYDELPRVLESIDRTLKKGLPVKINCVLQKGINEGEWKDLAEFARDRKVDVRFIEMMPVGYGKQCAGISGEEIRKKILLAYPDMQKETRIHGNGPAVYEKIPGFAGSIGFINAVHGKFCDRCNRIRLTAEGELKPCLCYGESTDLKRVLREEGWRGQSENSEKLIEAVAAVLRQTIEEKPKEHCFDSVNAITENRRMVQIGG